MEKENNNHCVTYPRLIPCYTTNGVTFKHDLDSFCSCGKPYNQHKEWQVKNLEMNLNHNADGNND
jgi:hypothetical protein